MAGVNFIESFVRLTGKGGALLAAGELNAKYKNPHVYDHARLLQVAGL